MALIGYSLSGLIAVGIVFIGARFLWNPAAASRDFGIPSSIAVERIYRMAGGERRAGHRVRTFYLLADSERIAALAR
jgi:hypothetical protein